MVMITIWKFSTFLRSIINKKAVLKINVDFTHSVDWSGMRETPAGLRGRGDPTQAQSAEEAPRNAREPHAHGAEINRQV